MPPPTVIVQAPPPPAPALRPTRAARIWTATRRAGPALASVAALVISVLAYNDQHAADTVQVQAQVRHDAEQVSWIPEPDGDLTIVNASTGVISDIVLTYGPTLQTSRGIPEAVPAQLKTVAPCSAVTISFHGSSPLAAFAQRAAAVLDMFFRDRDDRSWLVDRTGLLTSVAADAAGYYDGRSVPSPLEALIRPIPARLVTIRRAQTCS